MGILVSCECGKTFKVPEKFAGKKGKCAGCGKILDIPVPVGHGEADEPVIGFAGEGRPVAPVRQAAGVGRGGATTQAKAERGAAVPPPPPPPPPVEDDGLYDLAPPEVPPPPVARPMPVTPAARSAAAGKGKVKGGVRPMAAAAATVAPGFVPPTTVIIEKEEDEDEARKSWKDYLYLVLLAALIPLAVSLISNDRFRERVWRTAQKHPEVVKAIFVEHVGGDAEDFEDDDVEVTPGEAGDGSSEGGKKDAEVATAPTEADGAPPMPEEFTEEHAFELAQELVKRVPDRRLDGALLSSGTSAHWLMALGAAAVFFVLLLLLFERERVKAKALVLAGVFTGTVGVLMLLLVQAAAFSRWRVRRVRGRAGIILLFLLFIRFSYMAAELNTGFILSFLGFTFGVGLLEELCKALPLIWLARQQETPGWRGFMLLGLASGVGFGVCEGIIYSSSFYNGFSGTDIYLTRFVSCVALHAIWAASVAVAIEKRQDMVCESDNWGSVFFGALALAFVPMVLHGLYDTFLKKEMNVMALVTALASFAFLAFQIEMRRKGEQAEEDGPRVRRGALA